MYGALCIAWYTRTAARWAQLLQLDRWNSDSQIRCYGYALVVLRTVAPVELPCKILIPNSACTSGFSWTKVCSSGRLLCDAVLIFCRGKRPGISRVLRDYYEIPGLYQRGKLNNSRWPRELFRSYIPAQELKVYARPVQGGHALSRS